LEVNLGDKRESFIRTWIWLFKGLKDWDEIQTRTWAKQWDDTLKSSISPFYSWGPVKVAVPSLVDRNIINVATGDIQGLYDDIRKAITEGAEPGSSEMQHPDRIAGFDWDEVREQVRSFIEKHARENK